METRTTINYVLLISEGLTSLTVIQNQLAAQILSGTVIELFFFKQFTKNSSDLIHLGF